MQLARSQNGESWQMSPDPIVLGDVFLPEKHVAIWQRQTNETIRGYFDSVFDALGQGLRSVYALQSIKESLLDELPEGYGKLEAIEDIHLLSDMLTCLFDCQEVGLRLTPLSKAMCPRFHIDNIPARLVCTYLGEGTQWLPTEQVNHEKLGRGANGLPDDKSGIYADPSYIQQLSAFDVGLLKGSAWDNEVTHAAVHRSCPVEQGHKRVLLSLDPM